jgi:gamma-glutamyltranspeptidase/glutathione hydrolase
MMRPAMFTSHRFDPERGSARSMVLARHGIACTSQPLASHAAADLLRGGANALDAAIAAAAVLGVVEPFMTGVGGDCFIMYWEARTQRLYGLNGSGRAPAAATPQALRERGIDAMPMQGILSVTVPGAVDAWCCALERFGTRSLADVLAPAIHYAEDGFPVSEVIAAQWQFAAALLQQAEARRAFTIEGRAPQLGEIVRLPALARSLRALAAGGRDVLYRGALGDAIAACSRAAGGLLDRGDLAAHTSEWVEPLTAEYRGYTVCELPPNGQGITALLALNVLDCFDLDALADDLGSVTHLQIEAVKLAFADRNRYVADPAFVRVPVSELLSKDYAQGRAALIDPAKARTRVAPGVMPGGGDTVYLTTADAAGNVCSLINSLYFAFGSGIVAGDTGIVLQNRGAGFSLDPAHPNVLAPSKRPFHTLVPAMMMKDGRPLVSFGVMGGDMQAQGHVQLVSQLVDAHANIQEAIDHPRFHYLDTDRVALEPRLAARVGAALAARGHALTDPSAALLHGGFGGAQGVMIDPVTGAYWGGSDSRKDGVAVGF